MQSTNAQVFWGTLSWIAPDFRLETPSGDVLLVFFDDELARFVREHEFGEHRRVSILGDQGLGPRGELVAILNPSNVVSHHHIAVRAYEIYRSGQGGSAFDNWLAAERQLLERRPH
jgi:Protein of unknown function (DUF2934)